MDNERQKLHGLFVIKDNEYYYRYLSDIVDVRKGKHALSYSGSPRNMTQKMMEKQALPFGQNNNLTKCLMTVVVSATFTNPEFLTFMTTSREVEVVNEWTEYIFNLALNIRRTQHGVLYYMEKLMAPLRYANSLTYITIDLIARTIVPSEQNKDEYDHVRNTLRNTKVFSKRKCINCAELTDDDIFEIYVAITEREEIQQIFNRRTRDRKTRRAQGFMSMKRIERFLNKVQRDPRQNEVLYPMANWDTIRKLLGTFNKNLDYLTSDGFAKYLLSDENVEITNYSLRLVEENMHEPLSCYYINSSHNSYLKGAQIYHARYFCSDPSTSADVEIYRQILLSGCRCVEIDCWDGSDGEPIVTHGPTEITFIEPVLFKDVCMAIAECAFKTSEYPVCISVENHCCSMQQTKMARIFLECFGDMLLREPIPGYPLEAGVSLPSPYKLRRKILIKARKKERFPAERKGSLVTQTSRGVLQYFFVSYD
uniref:Phosphoinositide phospholipase C n=1 Tax=Syphacia muris TaxID=451379 RepID=A0A0N5AFK7_9BILA